MFHWFTNSSTSSVKDTFKWVVLLYGDANPCRAELTRQVKSSQHVYGKGLLVCERGFDFISEAG